VAKEFRYLCTIRVIAVVYQNLSLRLHLALLFTGTGQTSDFILHDYISQSLVFLLNSRSFQLVTPRRGYFFSRSYESILPSSFSIVILIALIKYILPPESVFGTVHWCLAFSGEAILSLINPLRLMKKHTSVTLNWFICVSSRVHIRSRLTLRGLSVRRKPKNFGEEVFYFLFVTHVSILDSDISIRAHALTSTTYGTFRYQITMFASSVINLIPINFRR